MSQVLLHGECLELMDSIPDKSIDMILCDLPYGTTACKWDVIIPFDKLWTQYERVIKDNGAIVLFGSQPFTSVLGASNLKLLKYSWVWEKTKPTNYANAKKQPLRSFEDVLVFYKKQSTYNPQGLLKINKTIKNTGTAGRGSRKQNGDQTSVISGGYKTESYVQEFTNYPRGFIVVAENGLSTSVHPTQKPVPLLEYLIKTYTNAGELVLDNTMGSGSTGVACVNTDRDFIGIEKDDKYFAIAETRIAEAASQKTAPQQEDKAS